LPAATVDVRHRAGGSLVTINTTSTSSHAGGLQARENGTIAAELLSRATRSAYPYLLLLPMLVVYTVFVAWPTVQTLFLSLYRIDGIMIHANRAFVGLQNFARLIGDQSFWHALVNNIAWTVFSVTIPVGFGLLLAVMLSTPNLQGRTAFRTILFMPQILALVVIGLIGTWMFNPYYGPVNQLLNASGLGFLANSWLGSYATALPTLLVIDAWHGFGFCMVIFLAGLQTIDENLYDAAKIDGASRLQQFFFVTLPGLRNATTVVILVMMIESFKVFDIVRVTTNGGPGDATQVLSLLLFKKVFFADDVGYGAAVAVVNTMLIITLSTGYVIYRRRAERNS
jgi:ABC-type sugar transport system permease subunit